MVIFEKKRLYCTVEEVRNIADPRHILLKHTGYYFFIGDEGLTQRWNGDAVSYKPWIIGETYNTDIGDIEILTCERLSQPGQIDYKVTYTGRSEPKGELLTFIQKNSDRATDRY